MARSVPMLLDVPGATLAGSLHLPPGDGPHPAVVMLQGSGIADRDSGGFFPPIRAAILRAGVAVLSWDKPGVGESGGDWRHRSFDDRADEALTAIAWLRARSDIDPGRVGIWGHSQGGWVGPLAASRATDLAFLVINSGTHLTAEAQDTFGVEHTLRAAGGDDADVAAALAFMTDLHNAARCGDPYDEVAARLLDPVRGTHAERYAGVDSPTHWDYLVRAIQHLYDPIPPLRVITCPVLANFGELDRLVPANQSAERFRQHLGDGGHTDLTIRIYAGADHRIRIAEPFVFAPGYLAEQSAWIADRAGLGAPA